MRPVVTDEQSRAPAPGRRHSRRRTGATATVRSPRRSLRRPAALCKTDAHAQASGPLRLWPPEERWPSPSILFLRGWRPARLYHFLRASRHDQAMQGALGSPRVPHSTELAACTCRQLNFTRPIDSFSATAKNELSGLNPTYKAHESRCWLTAHSLRGRDTDKLTVRAHSKRRRWQDVQQGWEGGGRVAQFGDICVAGADVLRLHLLELRMYRVPLLARHLSTTRWPPGKAMWGGARARPRGSRSAAPEDPRSAARPRGTAARAYGAMYVIGRFYSSLVSTTAVQYQATWPRGRAAPSLSRWLRRERTTRWALRPVRRPRRRGARRDR